MMVTHAPPGKEVRARRRPALTVLVVSGVVLLVALTGLGCAAGMSSASSTLEETTQRTPGSSVTSTTYVVDAGAADRVSLSSAWLTIAETAGFNVPDVHPEGLELDFTPAGALRRLFIACPTTAGEVTATWDASGDRSDQNVNIAVKVAQPPVTTVEPVDDSAVDSVLAAIDAVGPSSMIAKMRALPSGLYRVWMARDFGTVSGDIQPGATAYQWLGSSFKELSPGDKLRKVNSEYVRLAVIAFQPTPAPGSPTTALESFGLAYFVIPVPGPTAIPQP